MAAKKEFPEKPLRGGFSRDEDGTATVEFVLWVPVFFLILGLIVDISMIFMQQSRMIEVSADAARRWAVGAYSDAEAENYARTNATFRGVIPSANSVQDGVFLTMELRMSPVDVTIFGILPFLSNQDIVVRSTKIKEGA